MTTPIGSKNTVSRILGQQQMQDFFEEIAPTIKEDSLQVVKLYLHDRRKAIVDVFLKYLSDDEQNAEIMAIFEKLNEYKEAIPPAYTPPSFMTRVKNKLKRAFSSPLSGP